MALKGILRNKTKRAQHKMDNQLGFADNWYNKKEVLAKTITQVMLRLVYQAQETNQ